LLYASVLVEWFAAGARTASAIETGAKLCGCSSTNSSSREIRVLAVDDALRLPAFADLAHRRDRDQRITAFRACSRVFLAETYGGHRPVRR